MEIIKTENDSSIEITKNTKGYTWSIKAYGTNPGDIADKLQKLRQTTIQLVKELEQIAPSS